MESAEDLEEKPIGSEEAKSNGEFTTEEQEALISVVRSSLQFVFCRVELTAES